MRALVFMLVFLAPQLAIAMPHLLGVPGDGDAATAATAAQQLRDGLTRAGWKLAPERLVREKLAALGGPARCDQACVSSLAMQLGDLIVVRTHRGGGWTAAQVERIKAGTSKRITGVLCEDPALPKALDAVALLMAGSPGELVITGGPEGADLVLNAQPSGRLPTGPVSLSTGRHWIRIGDGLQAGSMLAVDVVGGQVTRVDLDTIVPRAAVRKVWWRRPWVWAAAGAVVVGSSFAATRGFGTIDGPRTQVVVRFP